VLPRRIYVPGSWEHWSEDCKRVALKHEIAHIRRHDGLFQTAEIVVRALYFFHPLVWLLTRRLEQFREMACDDASTGTEHDSRLEYSRNLVEIAETVARDTLNCQSASALLRRKNELINRVKYQMKEGVMRNFSKRSTLALLTGLALLIVPLSWYPTDAAPDEKAEPKVKSSKSMQSIDVSIDGAGAIRVDGSPVTLEKLGDTLDAKATGDPSGYVVNIACANDVPMQVVFDVQRDLQSRDLVKVSYASDLPKAMPLVLPSKALEERVKSIPKENIAVIQVNASGQILLDGRKTPADELSKRIESLTQTNDKVIIGIQMENKTTYQDFVKVLDAVKSGNAQRILIHNPPK
jgi:biopolymer transport protein ExbD